MAMVVVFPFLEIEATLCSRRNNRGLQACVALMCVTQAIIQLILTLVDLIKGKFP